MSANTVIRITDCSIEDNTNILLAKWGKEQIMFEDYLIGNGVNLDKYKQIVRYARLLSYPTCLLESETDCIKVKLHKLTL